MSLKNIFVFLAAALVLLVPQMGVAAGLQKGILVVTCDDGHKSQWESLAPILQQCQIPATCYPVTSWIGDDLDFMIPAQLQTLKERGWEFGNHTKNHVDASKATDKVFLSDLDGAKQDLLGWGLGPIQAFAPPYGEFNSHTADLVKSRGYTSLRQAWTENSDVNSPGAFTPFALDVISLKSNADSLAIIAWLDKLARDKVAGVLVIHQVDVAGDTYSITSVFATQIFSHAAGLIAEGKLEATTISKMVRKIRPVNIQPALNLLLLN